MFSFRRTPCEKTVEAIPPDLYAQMAQASSYWLSTCAGDLRIIVRHVFRNALTPVLVHATLSIGVSILLAAGLGFLGLGVQSPTAEWGTMLGEGRQFIFSAPHLTAFPGIAIFLAILAFKLLGDGLRDALDPRMSTADRPAG
jgi:ABC-type dipeptide/oligopeptide/nickel transport system permease subunit